ncbi:MAG: tyrosine protein kinase [Leptothrix sp. (in: Bacteria)]|nr:tyrosine protein kinase [Leptothrix sp. (in: b-proteobacteria)]
MTASTHPSTHSANHHQDGPNTDFSPHTEIPVERSIGEIISQANNLSPEQIESILEFQRSNGVRFGEAAVALGLANTDDVLWALAQQFHYPYSQTGGAFDPEVVVGNHPFSEKAEAFRRIRSHLIMKMYNDPAATRHALAIMSPNSGDGKTYFAVNLAVAFAQLPGRTLLIDADMRSPRIHNVFKLSITAGLSSILSGRSASKVIQSVKESPSLFVLPVGVTPPNPLELLERPAFGMLLRELKTKFDRIIVDTPAHSVGADAAVLSARCGAALIVARKDKSSVVALEQMVRTVGMGSAQIVGSVLNEY